MPYIIILILILLMTEPAHAGFRCGTRLIVPGDSVGRLVKACGQPVTKYKSRERIGRGSKGKTASVTNWIYDRGRKKNMRVTVYNGKVANIELDR